MQYASADTDSAQFTGQCADESRAGVSLHVASPDDPLHNTWEELTNLDPYPIQKKQPKPSAATQAQDHDANFTYTFTYGAGDYSQAPASSALAAKSDTPQLDDPAMPADETSLDEVPQYQPVLGEYREAAPAPPSAAPSSRAPTGSGHNYWDSCSCR